MAIEPYRGYHPQASQRFVRPAGAEQTRPTSPDSSKFDAKAKWRKLRIILATALGLTAIGAVAVPVMLEYQSKLVGDELCINGVENDCWAKPNRPIDFTDYSDPDHLYTETASTINSLEILIESTDKNGNKFYQVGLHTQDHGVLTNVVPGAWLQLPSRYP